MNLFKHGLKHWRPKGDRSPIGEEKKLKLQGPSMKATKSPKNTGPYKYDIQVKSKVHPSITHTVTIDLYCREKISIEGEKKANPKKRKEE